MRPALIQPGSPTQRRAAASASSISPLVILSNNRSGASPVLPSASPLHQKKKKKKKKNLTPGKMSAHCGVARVVRMDPFGEGGDVVRGLRDRSSTWIIFREGRLPLVRDFLQSCFPLLPGLAISSRACVLKTPF